MLIEMKQELKKMKNDRPGERFKNEHKRARRRGVAAGWARILCLGLAIVTAAIGVVLVFIPGPAFVFFILSGALLASQWWAAACLLDKAEITLQRAWNWSKKKWTARQRR
ncbi:MAG: hypothetical protein K0R17_3882 [Rariglobus sp.]|nr:hypothetical protein [Rariglobus sp.]